MLALVSGGNRGIGFAIAKKLAEDGIDVVICGRDKKSLESSRKDLEKVGVKVWSFHCDLTKEKEEKSRRKLAKKVKSPKLDIDFEL